MKFQKVFTLALSCLLLLETPIVSLAASSPAVSQESDILFSETDKPSSQETDNTASQETDISFPQETISSPEVFSSGAADTETEDPSTEDIDNDSLDITLNYSTYSLTSGDAFTLTAATDASAEITWSSDCADIASVSSTGVVTAHKAGTATITATATVNTETGTMTGSASCIISVTNTISLNKKTLSLYTCQTGQLTAAAKPAGAVTWKSSAPAVAAVNSTGKITPKKAGSTTITAAANGVSASCKVTVKSPSLKLKTKATIYLQNPVTLTATATPKGTVQWKSSNTKIAAVNSKGKVTPKKTGTVTITASCNGLKKSCKITVKKPSVKLDVKSVTFFANNEYQLKADAKPSAKITWNTSDSKVAKVSKDGVITGVRAGTATITASVPGAKASCKVTIIENNRKLSRTSQVLMKGNSATLYLSNVSSYDSVSFELSDPFSDVADISYSGNSCKITARHAGTVTLNACYSTYVNNEWVTGKSSCTIKVINKGVIQQQASLAVKAKKTLTLKNVKKAGVQIVKTTWVSSNPKIAGVNRSTGLVTGKKVGSAKITATVNYSDGTSAEFPTNVKISNPKTASSYTVLSLGKQQKINLTGTNSYSTVKWKIKNSSLASLTQDGTVTAGYSTGKTTITITADGKTIKHQLIITNPQLQSSYKTLAPETTTRISVTGASSKSNITYKSKKTSVATVSKAGVVTAHSYGTANIIVSVDGVSFTFQVCVAPQRAVDACNTGYSIINSSTYSQARRMSPGYYDCSALVFRAYGCDSGLLGGIPSWAPTAASMASYLESTGKVIAYGGLSASKLRPGDLIFYRTPDPAGNGRYKNIYHVSMYYGGGYRLEKPLRYYYQESNIVMIARPIQ